MFERGLAGDAGLFRGAEHLLEMQALALVDNVYNQVGILLGDAIDDGGEVGGAVEHSAVGLHQDQRRHLLLVAVARNGDDERAFAFHRDTARLEVGDHRGDERIDARLALPQIEMDAEAGIFAVDADFRDFEEMLPQRAVSGPPGLQLGGRLARRGQPRLVAFAGGGGLRKHLLQIVHRHGRLRRIRTGVIRIEIDRRDAADRNLRDELAHLQAPVAHVNVAGDGPAIGAEQPLKTVADDGRAQMADMHGLGDVHAAEIEHHGLAGAGVGCSELRVPGQRDATLRERFVGDVKIDEAGAGDLNLREEWIGFKPRRDLLRDTARIGLGLLGGGERAVALKLREVGPVGAAHLTEGFGQALGRERGARDRAQFGQQRRHSPPCALK